MCSSYQKGPRQVLCQRLNILLSPNMFQILKLGSTSRYPNFFRSLRSWWAPIWAQDVFQLSKSGLHKYCFRDWISWSAPFLGPTYVSDIETWWARVMDPNCFQKSKILVSSNMGPRCGPVIKRVQDKYCFRDWITLWAPFLGPRYVSDIETGKHQ